MLFDRFLQSDPSERNPSGKDIYPRIHRFVVEIILIILLFHAAYKFLYWIFKG